MELSPKGLEPLWKIQFSARNRTRSSESMTGIKVPDGFGTSFPEQKRRESNSKRKTERPRFRGLNQKKTSCGNRMFFY